MNVHIDSCLYTLRIDMYTYIKKTLEVNKKKYVAFQENKQFSGFTCENGCMYSKIKDILFSSMDMVI